MIRYQVQKPFSGMRRYLTCLCFLTLSMCANAVQAQTTSDSKQATEVAQVVLGISSYARWPTAHPELMICVVGRAKYADALLDGSASSPGLRFKAQQLSSGAPVTLDCHIVYIGTTSDAEREKLFGQITGRPILSISEPNISCSVGSMFCLKFKESQLVFDVNLDSIARSGLRVHPNVLQLAKRKTQSP